MSGWLRIPAALDAAMRADLKRPHAFAGERIGYLYARPSSARPEDLIVAQEYRPVADEHYVDDPSVGARIDSNAIHDALQTALDLGAGAFHVHIHEFGSVWPSTVDLRSQRELLPSFQAVVPAALHGFVVLAPEDAVAFVWSRTKRDVLPCAGVSVIGYPLRIWSRT